MTKSKAKQREESVQKTRLETIGVDCEMCRQPIRSLRELARWFRINGVDCHGDRRMPYIEAAPGPAPGADLNYTRALCTKCKNEIGCWYLAGSAEPGRPSKPKRRRGQ